MVRVVFGLLERDVLVDAVGAHLGRGGEVGGAEDHVRLGLGQLLNTRDQSKSTNTHSPARALGTARPGPSPSAHSARRPARRALTDIGTAFGHWL